MRNVLAGAAVIFVLATALTGSAAINAPKPFPGPVEVTETNVDPATGAINVHEKGTALTLPGRLANPIYPFVARINGTLATPTVVSGPDPAGTRYAISSLTFTNTFTDSVQQANLLVTTTSTGTCSGSGALVADVMVPASQTVHLAFPQPLLSPALIGSSLCLVVVKYAGASTDVLEMMIVGDVSS